MTQTTTWNINVRTLKEFKNKVIGNPAAKRSLAQSPSTIQTLVRCLTEPLPPDSGSPDDIRIEAAHVLSSISYGNEESLAGLLRADALRSFLFAISRFGPSERLAIRTSFARALRTLAVAIADTVGPSQWGLQPETSTIRPEAKLALDFLLHIDSLDVFLPLLLDASSQVVTSICQLLASAIRTPEHRSAITDWLPPSERMKEIKTRRGWEKTSTSNLSGLGKQGGWVCKNLTALLNSRDPVLQEAVLSALAAISKDNLAVAAVLSRPPMDREMPSTLATILSLSRSRAPDVQLAAALCATRTIRACATVHLANAEDPAASARTVMNVINRIMSSASETPQSQKKACFILYHLIADDVILSHIAFERGALVKLSTILHAVTPPEPDPEAEEEEAESQSCLKEAALTAIAAIALFDNEIRRAITDDLKLLPLIHVSLSHRHVGVRYAACQCIRALSRAVAVLRTNIVDTGLGLTIFQIFKKEDEDSRVMSAALRAVCNIVMEFSPLRTVYMEQGLMTRLVQLLALGDASIRLNALWAVKNLLRKSSVETKRDVLKQIGWQNIIDWMSDADEGVQEQAIHVIRNIAEDEAGIEMIFEQFGPEAFLNNLVTALHSSHDDVVLQAVCTLANLANGHEGHQDLILSCHDILPALRHCLTESKTEIRRPAMACIVELIRNNPSRRAMIVESGIVSTLRHICEWTSVPAMSPGGTRTAQVHSLLEDDRDVIELAKEAIDLLDDAEDSML